jgi:ornithine cyclodeaminase
LDAALVDRIEESFAWVERGLVAQPPVLQLEVPGGAGSIDAKAAAVDGSETATVKIATYFPDNTGLGLNAGQALVVAFSAKTGEPTAILLDNSYLTDARTAAAGAVAARLLSRLEASVAAVFGTGLQAYLQVVALSLVRDLREVRVWGRDQTSARRLASKLSKTLGLEAEAHSSSASTLSEADVVVMSTASTEGLIRWEELPAGVHVTAMGSDMPGKRELGEEILQKASVFCDSVSQCRELGELQHAPDVDATEIGSVVTGRKPGRETDDQITVADLTGMGVQDAAIVQLALELHDTSA